MPLFIYKATDANNQIVEGTVVAPTAEEVSQVLKRKVLVPVSIAQKEKRLKADKALPTIEKITFCRYMSSMLNSGLSLTEGIPVLKEETKNPLMRQILDDIMYHLEQGQALSIALQAYPNAFDKFFLTLVKSGEVSGTMGDSFKYLEQKLRAEYALSQKLKSAMVYPAVVVMAMLGIGYLMLFFILPQIGEVFLKMTIPLPEFTRLIFTFAIAIAKFRYPLIGVSLLGAILLIYFMKQDKGKKLIIKAIAPMPVINSLLMQMDIARFCRIFSTLVKSAVPIIEALEIALSSLSHPKYLMLHDAVTEKVRQGKTVAAAFRENPAFPGMLIQMIAAGEKSGTLDEALADMSRFYEEEVEEAVKKSTQLLEPLLMLGVGIGVGAMILAIIAPLYSVVGNLQDMQR